MYQASTYFSLLLLTCFATLHLGRTWVEEGIDEQFYSLSATDAMGQNIPMSSYVGKVLLIVNVASECGYTHTHYSDLVRLQRDLEYTALFHILAFPCNQFGQQEPKEICTLHKFIGATEDTRPDIVGPSKLQGLTSRDLTSWHQVAGVNITRPDNAASDSKGGQRRTSLDVRGNARRKFCYCDVLDGFSDITEIVKFASDVYNVNFKLFDKVDVVGDTASSLWTFLKERTGHAPDWNFWKYLIDHRGNVIGPWGPQISVNELSPVVRKAVGAARSQVTEPPFSDSTSSRSHPNIIREL